MPKKNENKQSVKKAIQQTAGKVLSNSEAKKIADQTGKSVAQVTAKATNMQIGVGAKLANQVSQSLATPGGQQAQNLGITGANNNTLSALSGLSGVNLNKGQMYQGFYTTNTPATSQNLGSGTAVKYTPSSSQVNPIIGIRNTQSGGATQKGPYDGIMDGNLNTQGGPLATTTTTPANPDQATLDRIAELETLLGTANTQIGDLTSKLDNQPNFQDTLNTQQQYYDQRMADLGNVFNMGIAQQQNAYNQQVQQAALLAQQEQEAARAFMINQGRSVMPANLQIGANYGTPQLAGTQGFKSPSRTTTTTTPAQVATAFTTPTLAAATQPTQTPVLNV